MSNVYDEILEKEDKCWICGSKSNLEPHHILYTNKYDELHRSIDNLIVMCHDCHHEYHQQHNYDLNFKTLMKFKGDYHTKQCAKQKQELKKLRKENKTLRKRIRYFVNNGW